MSHPINLNQIGINSVPRIRRFLGGAIAVGLALLAQSRLQQGFPVDGALLYGIALVWFIGIFRQSERASSPSRSDESNSKPGATLIQTPITWSQPWLWSVLALLAMGCSIWAVRTFDFSGPSIRSWYFYVASVVLFVVAGLLADVKSWRFSFNQFPSRQILLTLLGIVLIGAALRVYRLDELPFGTWYDEAANGIEALRIINEEGFRPVYTDGVNATGHYLFLIARAFELFGVGTMSLRLISVIMGVGVIVAGYLAGRELFGPRAGLLLAFLLAVSRWAINFSRLGMYNITTPLFALLAIAFVLRALRLGKVRDYTLAGLWIGLGLCYYSAFQLFVVTLALFLAYVMLVERKQIRYVWAGFAVMLICSLLVVAPVVKYAYERPESYFSRVRKTSLWTELARGERVSGLVENTRKHLLMFNVRGDPNGRHNLPGEPMMDGITGALMVLGVGLSLWRFRQPKYLLIPVWIFVGLLGGILSLGFEAPQSLRSIGALPAVYIAAVIPLHLLWQEWERGGGRYYPQFATVLAVALLLPAAYSNYVTYFQRQAKDFASWNGFSTPETITAKKLVEIGSTADTYLISLFDGHPTIRFLTQNQIPYGRLETTAQLPLLQPATRDIALFLDAERRALFEEAKRIYPNARFEEIQPPFGGPTIVYFVYLTEEDLASVQGLTARYYVGERWADATDDDAPQDGVPQNDSPQVVRQEPSIVFDWPQQSPVKLPFWAEWEGTLAVESYGPHQFFLHAPADAELYIGDELILNGESSEDEPLTNAVVLAKGKHPIRIRAVGGEGGISLAWKPPDHPPELLPSSVLYVPPVRSNGLLGRYYSNGEWAGEETFARIDPRLDMYFHNPALTRPYSVEWEGKIAIPESGIYSFGVRSIDDATVWIDEHAVARSVVRGEYTEGDVELETGLHDIRVRYADRTDHTFINLYWTPKSPGLVGTRQIIPPDVLFPPGQNYEQVDLLELEKYVISTSGSNEVVAESTQIVTDVEVMADELAGPKGVAVGADGTVYVAESEGAIVSIWSASGQRIGELEGGETPFVEPFDLAIGPNDRLYVLDAGRGEIVIFDGVGDYASTLSVDAEMIARSRGIYVDDDGRIWVANTPGGRTFAFGGEAGEVALEIPRPAGEVWSQAQPVDVAVGNDGTILVTDSGVHKLVVYNEHGQWMAAWDIPNSNSIDSSHMAVGSDGTLYLTQPEPGLVARFDEAGRQTHLYDLQSSDGKFIKPVGVAIGADNLLWVADSENERLIRFRLSEQGSVGQE